MIEDHEGTAARDIVGVVRLPFGFQTFDFGLKLTEPGVHIVRKLLGRPVLLGQTVEFNLHRFKGGPIFRQELDRMRVGPAHAVGMWEIEMRFRPFPALSFAYAIGGAPELSGDQQIEQCHILKVAAAILGKEIAQDGAARLGVGLDADEPRSAIRGGDMGFGEQAADGAGIAVVGQPLIDGLLPGMVSRDGESRQLLKGQIAVAIDLH